jgi:hypothetical protein
LADHSHRRIAAVVLDSDMTMRFGAVRLLVFELLLPPTRFSTRFVSASELIAFVDLVWGPGIFISNHLGGSPFGSRGCRDERLIGDILDKFDFEQGDVLDMPRILQSIKKNNVTHVVHAAAFVGAVSASNPALSIQVNVMLTCWKQVARLGFSAWCSPVPRGSMAR